MSGTASAGVADRVVQAVGLDIRFDDTDWPLVLSRHSCVAQKRLGSELIEGFGCGARATEAQERASMECLERCAQFQPRPPATLTTTAAELSDSAIPPESLGLYAPSQYSQPGFPFARYSSNVAIEWVQVTEVASGTPHFVPVEFIFPRSVITRRSLVAETSSGTAAYDSLSGAILQAVCETIERDSLLMFWHRRPPTVALTPDFVSLEAAADLEHIRSFGYLTVTCLAQYDLGVPCVLAFALKDDRFAYGAGCHPSLMHAADHAVRELGNLVRWQLSHDADQNRLLYLSQVKKPADHYAIYDRGPFHRVIRQTLANTIRPSLPLPERCETDPIRLLQCLGFTVFACDITPPGLVPQVHVIRVLIPGLIPMYFGYDRIRLGCERLRSSAGPGRFCTLLPHFMA